MISYGAMLGKIKTAVQGKGDNDTMKMVELLMDTWIDEVEELLKENSKYQDLLQEILKHERQVQLMGLSKEKRIELDRYITAISEKWILYSESLYKSGMQKIIDLLNL